MSADVEQVRQELTKAASLVGTARRLLSTGTEVDLTALEGKVRFVCDAVAALDRKDGQGFRPDMEALIADLDRLAAALQMRHNPTSLDA